MAGKKIELTTDLLISQSIEMSSLSNDYENLFANITYTLMDANNNWSPNLSKNFSGKINSATRSFTDIVSMLNAGSTAARNSATTMENLDKNLAKAMGGESNQINISSISNSITATSVKRNNNSSLLNQIFNEYTSGWNSAQQLAIWYDNLPEEQKKAVSKILKTINPDGTLDESFNILIDVLKANSAWEVGDLLVNGVFDTLGKYATTQPIGGSTGWGILLGTCLRGLGKVWQPSDLKKKSDIFFEYNKNKCMSIMEDYSVGDWRKLLVDSQVLLNYNSLALLRSSVTSSDMVEALPFGLIRQLITVNDMTIKSDTVDKSLKLFDTIKPSEFREFEQLMLDHYGEMVYEAIGGTNSDVNISFFEKFEQFVLERHGEAINEIVGGTSND